MFVQSARWLLLFDVSRLRATRSGQPSGVSRALFALQSAGGESDDDGRSAVERRRRLVDAIRPELHDEDGDATLLLGIEPSGSRMVALVMTDVRVLVVGATLYGRPLIKCCWPRSEVRVARFRERGDGFELHLVTSTRKRQIAVARSEHERAKAVVEALGGYPRGWRLSCYFVGPPPRSSVSGRTQPNL